MYSIYSIHIFIALVLLGTRRALHLLSELEDVDVDDFGSNKMVIQPTKQSICYRKFGEKIIWRRGLVYAGKRKRSKIGSRDWNLSMLELIFRT